MKFLENAKLEALSSALSVENDGCQLETRLETYSCKMVQNDKRQWKDVLNADGTKPDDLQPLSPPVNGESWIFSRSPNTSGELQLPRTRHRSASTSGSDQDTNYLCDTVSRKTLFYLVAVLNSSFPDYDFTDAKGENFSKGHSDAIHRTVTNHLSSAIASFDEATYNQFWSILNEEISIKECQIYSYNPESGTDPFTEDGCIWSFNYMFYNKRLKRILFFACRCLKIASENTPDNNQGQLWTLE